MDIFNSVIALCVLSATMEPTEGFCPRGGRLVTIDEAYQKCREIGPLLGKWEIARLDGGGSISGKGYQPDCLHRIFVGENKIEKNDNRKLKCSIYKKPKFIISSINDKCPAGYDIADENTVQLYFGLALNVMKSQGAALLANGYTFQEDGAIQPSDRKGWQRSNKQICVKTYFAVGRYPDEKLAPIEALFPRGQRLAQFHEALKDRDKIGPFLDEGETARLNHGASISVITRHHHDRYSNDYRFNHLDNRKLNCSIYKIPDFRISPMNAACPNGFQVADEKAVNLYFDSAVQAVRFHYKDVIFDEGQNTFQCKVRLANGASLDECGGIWPADPTPLENQLCVKINYDVYRNTN